MDEDSIVFSFIIGGIFLIVALRIFLDVRESRRIRNDKKASELLNEMRNPKVSAEYEYETSLDHAQKYGLAQFRIDDAFTIKGRGTVVTGKVENGVIRVGDEMVLHRRDGVETMTKVSAIETFRKKLDSVGQGENAGLQLDGIKRDDVYRGDTLIANK